MENSKVSKRVIKALKIILFEIVFIGITSPIVAFYGPFNRVRYVLVGSSMQTSKHQYIARFFLSDKAIASILDEKKSNAKTKNTDTSKFKTNEKVEFEELDSNKHFKGYAVIVHDPKRVRIGMASDFNVSSMSVDTMAARYDAIAAVNGSGYDILGSKQAEGYIIDDGKIKVKKVKDNNEKINAMLINKTGKLLVGDYSINDIKKLNINEAVCFGPTLIVDGKAVDVKEDGGYGIAERTAIGQKADGTIIMITVNGRNTQSFGATIKDLQDVMLQYGVVNGYNLDGGGSSHIYYNGKSTDLNDNFMYRSVPDIVYVK